MAFKYFVMALAALNFVQGQVDKSSIEDALDMLNAASQDLTEEINNSDILKQEALSQYDGDLIVPVLMITFEAVRRLASAYQTATSIAENSLRRSLDSAYGIIDNAEDRVKSAVDKERLQIEAKIEEANKIDSQAGKCAVDAAEPFEDIAAKTYEESEHCATDRVDEFADSIDKIAEVMEIPVQTMKHINFGIHECIESPPENITLKERAIIMRCLTQMTKYVDSRVFNVPTRIGTEAAKIRVYYNTLVPRIEACQDKTLALTSVDFAKISANVEQCLV